MLNSWAITSTVKPAVRAVSSDDGTAPPGACRWMVNSVAAATGAPITTKLFHIRRSMTRSSSATVWRCDRPIAPASTTPKNTVNLPPLADNR